MRKERGDESAKGGYIRKHCNDIVRLLQLVPPDTRIALPDSVRTQLLDFVVRAKADASFTPGAVVTGRTLGKVIEALQGIYVPSGPGGHR